MHVRDLTQYLAELAESNQRAWFVMNKPRYDILRLEFLELVTQLIADLSRTDLLVAACDPKKALFRIHRDMRFSHDKRPYKTRFSSAITATGLKNPSQGGGPAYYFHIDETARLLIAVGEYMPPAPRLRAIREHIVAAPEAFDKVIHSKKLRAHFSHLEDGAKLLRPPKGFAADAPHVDYLKLKSMMVWHEIDLHETLPEDLGKLLATHFKQGAVLIDWLRQA